MERLGVRAAEQDVQILRVRQADLQTELRLRGVAEITVVFVAAGQLQLGRTGDRRFVNRRGHLDILRGDGPFAGEREAAAGAEVGRRVGRGRQPVIAKFDPGRDANVTGGQLKEFAGNTGVIGERLGFGRSVGDGEESVGDRGIVGRAERIQRSRAGRPVEGRLIDGGADRIARDRRHVAETVADGGLPVPLAQDSPAEAGEKVGVGGLGVELADRAEIRAGRERG